MPQAAARKKTDLQTSFGEFLSALVRFGIVGTCAVLTQAIIFFVLANYAGFSGVGANTIGCAASLIISYLGQSRWTFSDRKDRSIPRFLVIAIVSFILSSGSGWVAVDWVKISPFWVLPIILLLIPFTSFLMM